ncbi:MAG TPA: type II toxin-antitoxin system RelE/ParE family toxin [Streptosporangiaceae bacterium]
MAARGGPGAHRSPQPAGLLAEQAETLGEPHTRHLSGRVRELRFHLLTQQTRVTYWPAPGRRVILLTVFRKTPQCRDRRSQSGLASPEDLRGRARASTHHVRSGGALT